MPFLIETLKKSDDPYFKTYVAYALGELRDKKAVKPLLDYISANPNNLDILWAVVPALGKLGDNSTEVKKFLYKIAETKRSITKTMALLSLYALGEEAVGEQLGLRSSNKDPLQKIDPAAKYFAVKVLGIKGEKDIPTLLALVYNQNYDTRLRITAIPPLV